LVVLKGRRIWKLTVNVATKKFFNEQMSLEQYERGRFLIVWQVSEEACHIAEHPARGSIVCLAHS